MTRAEMETSTQEYLLAKDVAALLGMDANTIRFMARERPDLLGFPVTAYKNENSVTWHVKIPRRGFLYWLDYGNAPVATAGTSL